jgi:hypothetical protein
MLVGYYALLRKDAVGERKIRVLEVGSESKVAPRSLS